jgi:hypothetical protein
LPIPIFGARPATGTGILAKGANRGKTEGLAARAFAFFGA